MSSQFQTQILKSIYFSGTQSIAEISAFLGKSIPVTTKAVQQLIENNYIVSGGLRASTGGRRAAVYNLNTKAIGNILSISINRYSIVYAIYNISNELISDILTTNIDHFNDEEIYQSILTNSKKLIDEYQHARIFAIGVTTPGFVDSQLGVNNSYPKKSPLHDLAKRLKDNLHIDTYIENDSSAIAIAEKHFGKAKTTNHALVINLTWGVGLGIIVDQQLFRGNNGFAGEFSHIPLADESKLCSCGKKGCLEVEASLESSIDYIKEKLKEGEVSQLSKHIDNGDKSELLEALIQSYKQGDQLSIYAIKKIGYMLGKGIATLIHILNPASIIISGIGSVFGNILLNEIQSSIHIYCIPRLAQRTSIEISDIAHIQPIASACVAVTQSESLTTS